VSAEYVDIALRAGHKYAKNAPYGDPVTAIWRSRKTGGTFTRAMTSGKTSASFSCLYFPFWEISILEAKRYPKVGGIPVRT